MNSILQVRKLVYRTVKWHAILGLKHRSSDSHLSPYSLLLSTWPNLGIYILFLSFLRPSPRERKPPPHHIILRIGWYGGDQTWESHKLSVPSVPCLWNLQIFIMTNLNYIRKNLVNYWQFLQILEALFLLMWYSWTHTVTQNVFMIFSAHGFMFFSYAAWAQQSMLCSCH